MTNGIVYYTDGMLDPTINKMVRDHIKVALNEERISKVVSVTIGAPDWDYGIWLTISCERGYLTMFKQILLGLETVNTDVTYLCEHDVLYHSSHFDAPAGLCYNQNVWKVNAETGHAIHYPCSQTSGLSGPTDLLINHYKRRVKLVESGGFTRRMGFEPGTHNRPERVDDLKASTWMSTLPNVDIRHKTNLTSSKWSKDDFRNPKFAEGWIESDTIPGWGKFLDMKS